MFAISDDDRVCGTCVHYGHALAVTVILPAGGPFGSGPRRRAPCLIHAVDPDAGYGAVALLGPESHCRCHRNAWEPSDDFLDELEDEDDRGVLPGVDFPYSLRR